MTNLNSQETVGLVPPNDAAAISGLDFLRRLLDGSYPTPPFSKETGIWLVSIELGRVVFEAMPSARYYNPMGIVHGGWIATLLDSAMACAVHSSLAPGHSFVTLEMKTVFVKAVLEQTGKLRCEGTLLHAGGRVASSEGRIYDGKGILIAHGSETCLVTDSSAGR
ncbi:MAG TPA: PaaI family thioesterase [Candidatus Binataceae bacterium]|nr:PaaI family thioesterase [Candidatus Binataceae bacterium]